jgi:hypothetical protein
MKATVPRPEGPSIRARSSAATKKPAEPTMLEAKKRTDPRATETGAVASGPLRVAPTGVAGTADSDGVDNVEATPCDVRSL